MVGDVVSWSGWGARVLGVDSGLRTNSTGSRDGRAAIAPNKDKAMIHGLHLLLVLHTYLQSSIRDASDYAFDMVIVAICVEHRNYMFPVAGPEDSRCRAILSRYAYSRRNLTTFCSFARTSTYV